MAIRLFSKIRKPTGFNYTPRYYDEAKEQLEEKLKRYKTTETEVVQTQDQISKSKENIRSTFRKKQKGVFTHSSSTQNRQSNIRLVQIIALLTIIAYLILKSDVVLNFIQKISG